MENPVEGVVKVQPEGSGSAPVSRAPAAQGRPVSTSAPEAPKDTVDISTAAQAAASTQALKVQNQANKVAAEAPQAPSAQGFAPSISFNYNKDMGVLQAAVVDPVTHKVIRQIPPDEVLKMGARFRNLKEQLGVGNKVSGVLPVGFEGTADEGGGGPGGEQAA